jgi:carbon storage regulator
MLVLVRRVGESICVGEHIMVKILYQRGRQIHVGVEAPPEINIDREEIRKRKLLGLPPPPRRVVRKP